MLKKTTIVAYYQQFCEKRGLKHNERYFIAFLGTVTVSLLNAVIISKWQFCSSFAFTSKAKINKLGNYFS